MAEVVEPPPWLEHWTRRRIGVAGALGMVAPLVGIPWAPLAGDLALVVGSLGLGGLAGWAWRRRAVLETLPLVLGDCAVRQVVDGEPALRVRAWLGHGRVMADIEAVGRLELPDGRAVELSVEVPAPRVAGPVTLTVSLPPLARGQVHLSVRARAGGSDWAAEKRYALDAAVPGPLDVPVRRNGRRLAWDRAAWDRALSER